MAEGGVIREIKPSGPQPLTMEAAAEGLDLREKDLREKGRQLAQAWKTVPHPQKLHGVRARFEDSVAVLAGLQHALRAHQHDSLSEDLKWLSDHLRIFAADTMDIRMTMKKLERLPYVRSGEFSEMPRAWIVMRGYMEAVQFVFTESTFTSYVEGVIDADPLDYKELWALGEMTKLVLFDEAAKRGKEAYEAFIRHSANAPPVYADRVVRSLQLAGELDWEELVEPLSPVNHIFMDDPGGVYPRMDEITRSLYLKEISDLTKGTHATEVQIARLAVRMAADETPPSAPSREAARRRHVGYYLVGAGKDIFRDRIGYRPSIDRRLQDLLCRYPDEFYILFIEFLSLVTIAGIIMPFSHGKQPLSMLFLLAVLLFLPVTQAAIELVNYFVTSILKPKPLPKFDFSEGVPDDCKTLVAVPTLLINEDQIRQLVEDLEIRYLGNQDRNIHYALLTDLPDTAEPADEQDHRIEYAIKLIGQLNERYAHLDLGQFYLFHRHRVYNPQERTWMGWERKRGKLLDLNKLLRNAFDPFPIKAGDLTALQNVRFVITLDSDTQLPRGAAARMIGAMAHPLNAAIIDPDRNIVTEGYGILQPRVGISVQSAGRSRLASLYSGQTGFDIYTRAVSDVYQDLYGEGIFTGKGIYEVDTLRQVLEARFPTNTLLSHDLIEGAYARAGLLSDVEVIDDYPSHYSAYNRRKHRWLRGDWQIIRWLFSRVPGNDGRPVRNPISLISRWKIFDNLRRSLVEPGTFVLLVAGWLLLPGGAMTWTCVIASLLFLPGLFQFLFGLVRFAALREWMVLYDSATNLVTAVATVILNFTFLAHQAMVAVDAIVRTIYRSTISRRSLLEWETATESELGIKKRTPVDVYLDLMPLVALVLGVAVGFIRLKSLPYALPVLILWACSKLVSNWLNLPPVVQAYEVSAKDRELARNTFLKTWRFFVEFSGEKNHWLIPDNVQETPPMAAERISTTNLGFLLNARQAAYALGSLTVTELADLTRKTIDPVLRLPRFEGHFYNWYDNLTLEAVEPRFISTVDNGNLIASLWSLSRGLADSAIQPIFKAELRDGLLAQLQLLRRLKVVGRHEISTLAEASIRHGAWIIALLKLPESWPLPPKRKDELAGEAAWWVEETRNRRRAIRRLAEDFAPWLLPEYDSVRNLPKHGFETALNKLVPETASVFYQGLERRIDEAVRGAGSGETADRLTALRGSLSHCRQNAGALRQEIAGLSSAAEQLARDMDFSLLYDQKRKLLSVGYNVNANRIEAACYDLMASEARIAFFVAVAKGEIPQESWFRLGRTHTVWQGEKVLASWTGTMFEYLMPALWMKLYSGTLLDRSARAAVRLQEKYAAQFRVPWGISESGWSERNADGQYQYRAFGVPTIALKNPTEGPRLVISPYSSWLALMVDPESTLSNASRMASLGWDSIYGFYEAADYGAKKSRWARWQKPEIVRMWMAHHQGMTLLALANWLGHDPFVRWFHADRRVQATALLLQEKPLRTKPLPSVRPDLARLAHVQRWKAAI
ncbi:MAG: glucoamylase family protein [Bryobacteraceae bacterium]